MGRNDGNPPPHSDDSAPFVNHLAHHRGQVHAMLTAAGARPGDTDLPFMPDDQPTAG